MTTIADAFVRPRYSLVGPGRVGTSLAVWLGAGGARLNQVGSRVAAPGTILATTYGGTRVEIEALDSSADDLLLLSVGDDALDEVVETLSRRPQAGVVLHVSGSVPVEVLAPFRDSGSEIGGLHPLRAFPQPSASIDDAVDLVFAIGGDPGAVALAESLTDAWGGVAARIRDDQRDLYHLAASLSAGGMVTLMATVETLGDAAGLPPELLGGFHRLADQALAEAARRGRATDAITGPVARGDSETIERYLTALEADAPEVIDVVASLAAETLRRLEGRGIQPPNADEIRSILAKSLQRKSFLDRK